MNIDEYTRETRILAEESSIIPFYEQAYQEIISAFPRPDLLPKLRVVYSMQRCTETVTLGSSEYIIYDQYLGQTFNMLNRILLNSNNTGDSLMYFYKLLAERYAVGGRFELGELLAHTYTVMFLTQKEYKQDKNIFRRMIFTASQELFILSHEIAHVLIRSPEKYFPSFASLKPSTLTVKDKNEQYFQTIRIVAKYFDMPNGLAEAIIDNLFNQTQSLTNPDFNRNGNVLDSFKYVYKDKSDYYDKSKYIFITNLLYNLSASRHSNSFQEEVCCDVIALIIVLSIGPKLLGIETINLGHVLDAIAICLRHWRLLSTLESVYLSLIDDLKVNKDVPLTNLVYLSLSGQDGLIRSLYLRECGILMESKFGIKFNDISELAEEYERRMDNVLWFDIPERLVDVIKKMEYYKDTSNSSPKFTLRSIGEKTGFY